MLSREPWIVFDPKTHRAAGSGGCNRIAGPYEAGTSALRVGPMTSTPIVRGGAGMATEQPGQVRLIVEAGGERDLG